jgi:hypothetical protein
MFRSIQQRYKDHPQASASVMNLNVNSRQATIKIPEMKNFQDLLNSASFQYKRSDTDTYGPALKIGL